MKDTDVASARLLQAVAHPTRVWMVRTLQSAGEPLSATGWHARREQGDLTLGTIAYHVRELSNANLLTEASTARRRGAIERFYRLSPPGEFMADIVSQLKASPHVK